MSTRCLTHLALFAAAALNAQTRDTPLTITPGIQPPELILQVDADFTEQERHGLHECRVVTEVVIDEHGAVYQAHIVSSNDPRCNNPILAAVRQYRFRPATRNGTAVAVRKSLETDAAFS